GGNLSATTKAGTDGSIAVAYWAQDEMVIAADSRGTIGNSYHDTECKVSALVGINDNYITTGIFGDFESNTLKVFMSEVTYKIGPDGHANITANVTPAEWKLPGGGGNRFIGEGGMWSVLGE